MPKIDAFTKPLAKAMLDDLANVLKEFEIEWGVKVDFNGGSFESKEFKPRVIIKIPSASGNPYEKEELAWKRYAGMESLKDEWLGKEITLKTKRLRIVGFNPNRPKKCIVLVGVADGKTYITSKDAMLYALKRAA